MCYWSSCKIICDDIVLEIRGKLFNRLFIAWMKRHDKLRKLFLLVYFFGLLLCHLGLFTVQFDTEWNVCIYFVIRNFFTRKIAVVLLKVMTVNFIKNKNRLLIRRYQSSSHFGMYFARHDGNNYYSLSLISDSQQTCCFLPCNNYFYY